MAELRQIVAVGVKVVLAQQQLLQLPALLGFGNAFEEATVLLLVLPQLLGEEVAASAHQLVHDLQVLLVDTLSLATLFADRPLADIPGLMLTLSGCCCKW